MRAMRIVPSNRHGLYIVDTKKCPPRCNKTNCIPVDFLYKKKETWEKR
jgi:hypothetical protein